MAVTDPFGVVLFDGRLVDGVGGAVADLGPEDCPEAGPEDCAVAGRDLAA